MMRAALVAVVVVALFLAALWVFQRRLMYFPSAALLDADRLLPALERTTLKTRDGLQLGGWFVPAAPTAATRAAVLVLNGNAGNRSYRAPLAAALSRAGMSSLLFDYRGYGGNPGRPSERGLLEDGRAARAWLEARSAGARTPVVLFGESLGSALAIALAAEAPPAALVLRSPFTSMLDVARHHYGWLPISALVADRYDSLALIARVACPLLVVAGDGDRIVPLPLSLRVYEAAPEPKRLVVLRGADHNDEDLSWGERMIGEISRLVDGLDDMRGSVADGPARVP